MQVATCPLVENGVVRVLSSPHNSRRGTLAIAQVRERLREACGLLDHALWPDDVSLRDDDQFNFARVQGHNQITDLYLLALAVHHGGCLVSFDQAIALNSVVGATPKHLVLLWKLQHCRQQRAHIVARRLMQHFGAQGLLDDAYAKLKVTFSSPLRMGSIGRGADSYTGAHHAFEPFGARRRQTRSSSIPPDGVSCVAVRITYR